MANELFELLNSLNKEEKRNLTLHLKRINSSPERKDIKLMELITKKNIQNDRLLAHALYNNNEKTINSLYRLKNRLFTEALKSLNVLHIDKNDYFKVVNLLLISKLEIKREQYDLAVKLLQKAEKKALRNEYYDLLDLIYGELIKLSSESSLYNPLQYIDKRKENHKILHQLQEIDDVLAALSYKIKLSQNFSKHNLSITQMLEKTINDFVQDKTTRNSITLRTKIYQAVSRILLQNENYEQLENYLQNVYSAFDNEHLFNKNNHEIKLQMLVYWANALFKTGKIEKSLEIAGKLGNAILEYNKMLYEKYVFYYYNTLVMNYQVNDKQKAIEVLLEAEQQEAVQKHPMFIVFVYLNLAVFNFDLNRFGKAKRYLAKLQTLDAYDKLDKVFKMKILITLLQTYYESGDIDLFDNLLKRIKHNFKSVLEKEEYQKENDFIDILSLMDSSKNIKPMITSFIDKYKNHSGTDIINYTEWLKNKQ